MRGFLALVSLLVPSVGLACSCLRPIGKLELYVLDSLCEEPMSVQISSGGGR
jgi:hypothetical protein